MTPHNGAKSGDIAPSVLLPGDPLRAQFIAENFLEGAVRYNTVRNMFGYTGLYKGKNISVQGTGMGIPSSSIYVNELLEVYGCRHLVRIGTAGAINSDIKIRDVVMATSACTDSAVNRHRFNGMDYAPAPSFDFMLKAYEAAGRQNIRLLTGPVFSADLFYGDNPDWHKIWARYGVLAVEMEAAGLFTLAAKYKAHSLCLLTISDHLLTGEVTTAEERQLTFKDMMIVALEACVAMQDA
jgi:purine-nucleoside phosphorylase